MKYEIRKTTLVVILMATALLFSCNSDDPVDIPEPSAVSFDQTSVVLAENGGAQTVMVSLDVAAVSAVSVVIDLTSDNATYGDDYTTVPDGSSGSVSLEIAEGEENISFTVTPVDNEDIDSDKLITFTPSTIGGVSIDNPPSLSVFIENDEVSTLLMKEDFSSFDILTNDVSNAFVTGSWFKANSSDEAFTESSTDATISSFPGNGVGGSVTFDNTSDSQTGNGFKNLTRRFLDSDVTTSLDEQTFVSGTYYAAFNFTLNELDAATAARRYATFGKVIYADNADASSATAIASEWGAKMGIKGIQEDGVQKYMFGLHKRRGTSGFFGDLVIPDDSIKRDLGATYLVVIKVVQPDNIEPAPDVDPVSEEEMNSEAYMYVFAEGEDYSSEPMTPYATDLVGADVNINAFVLLGAQNNHSATYDGIRVANDWRSLFSE